MDEKLNPIVNEIDEELANAQAESECEYKGTEEEMEVEADG